MFMQKHTYICWIHPDAMNNRPRRTSLEKYIPLTLFVRLQKGYSRVVCERELETERKLQYFDLHLWPSTLCLSRSPGLLNRRPWAHSAGWWLLLLHLISNFSGPQTPSGFPRAPSAGCGFPYHISSITPTVCNSTCLTSVLTELYNSSKPTRSLKSNV